MTPVQKELLDLLQSDVIPDIEEYMDELFETINAKKDTQDDRNALKEMQEMHAEFNEMIEEIKADEMDDEECIEILNEIKAMIEG